ncbi:MAG: tyrosine-type recombinase/integrase [Clostridiales bacterium]|nr:tyrosine-type recombinase/integrase [Clostridiales bacterium]
MLEGFHFHVLRHTFTTNLLRSGVAVKDVQEMLGHEKVGTTMNVYAHGNRESKKTSAKLLDKLAS